MIHLKRAYVPAEPDDGRRFLVDRLWPRGIQKDELQIEAWVRAAAPSTALRKWYGHDPERWDEFRERYFAELEANPEAWQPLLEAARLGDITLLYSSRETERNNATALKEYLEKKL